MSDIAALVSDHLDIWTSAVERKNGGGKRMSLYGVERLRALIFDLAVRGKLVPQDTSDGDATTLLKSIANERRNYVPSRGLKVPKLSEQSRRDPFDLPDNWAWTTVGMTGVIFSGNSINEDTRARLASTEAGRPFVATKDVGYGGDPITYDTGLHVSEHDPSFVWARPATVFICAEGGSAGRKMALSDREICFGNKLIANETWGGVDPSFVLLVYRSDFFYTAFALEMTGIIGGISRAKFLALPFPLPPLAEQRRIAAKVHELMTLCDALERESAAALTAHQTLVETLLATVANSADAADLATHWSCLRTHFDTLFTTEASVDSLASALVELALRGFLTNGSTAPATQKSLLELLVFGPKNGFSPRSVDHDTGIKSLSLSATTRGQFDERHYKYVDIERPEESSELWIKNGDLLVQRANSIEYVGVAALYEGSDNCFIYPDLMMKIRFRADIVPKYAALCLNSGPVRRYLRSRASGTSGSMPKINQSTLLSVTIPVPDTHEQLRIVAAVNALKSLCDELKACIADAGQTQMRLADAIVERAAA
ncbi:MAG: hypothetical protein K1X35_03000 [Caulobacteraceae bacterium]|nr:hypothetical protein [Caulobacteraceae bacterium]